jgi:hypothetical protein
VLVLTLHKAAIHIIGTALALSASSSLMAQTDPPGFVQIQPDQIKWQPTPATKLKAFPAGSMFVVPANASHFHWMRSGEAVVQVSGVGPSGIEYVDRADDPRKLP